MAKHPGRGGHTWRTVCKQVYATSNICILCGQPINYDIPYPHPMSKTVQHRIPISRVRHLPPQDQRAIALNPANLGPAHKVCNERQGNRTTVKRSEQSRQW